MKRSEKIFAVVTGIVAFAITVFPETYEFGLPILALGAMVLFFFAHKSAFRRNQYGSFLIGFGSEDAPKSTLKQVETRWAAIGIALCVGVASGYLAKVFFD